MTTDIQNKPIPQGYKLTEVGIIPEDWDVKTLGSILKIRYGKSQKGIEKLGGKYPILGTGGLMGHTDTFLYDKPSVLIGRKGTIDKPQFWDSPFWTVDTLFYTEIFNLGDPKFIYYYFFKIDWYSYNEASGVPSLNGKTIEAIQIPLPPLAEQQRIAQILSDADTLLQHLDALIAKKQAIKQGTMQELLRPKEGWEVKTLGEFLDYEQPTNYLVSSTEYITFSQTPVLTAGKTFILGYTNEEHGIFTKLPVIIFDDFTTAIKFVDFPFKAKSSAMKMLLPKNSQINLRFIYEVMQQIKYPLGDHKRHWIGEYRHLKIIVPPTTKEQERIAQILSDIDKELEALEAKRAKYTAIKAGLMQSLLTGAVRV